MARRYKTQQYALMRIGMLPSSAEYSPNLLAVKPDTMNYVTGFGKSKSGQRTHPTESIRAIAYPGKDVDGLRHQLGIFSPGPAAYGVPSLDGVSNRPSQKASSGFAPHIIQPQSTQLAQIYLQEGNQNAFVKQFRKMRAKAMGETTGGDGEEEEGEGDGEEGGGGGGDDES